MQQIDYYLLHFLLSGYCKNPPGIQVDPKTRLTWLFLCPPPRFFLIDNKRIPCSAEEK